MASSVKQGIKRTFRAKNTNAKFKISYRYTYSQTNRGSNLVYSSSYSKQISTKSNLRYEE